MADSWEHELAGEFLKRNNPRLQQIGACIGKVESLSPVIISIQSGRYMLQANQIYICNQILERQSSYDSWSSSGSGSFPCNEGGTASGSYSESGSGSIHLNAVWQVGDYVMVVPDVSEQHFFIVDVLRGVS